MTPPFGVITHNRITLTVGEHVIAQDALAGGGEGVCVDEAADGGIVITGLQIIEPGFGIVVVAGRAV